MVLYSENDVVITLQEDYCVDDNIITFAFNEKFFHHFLLPKIFNRSVLSCIISRLGVFDIYDFYCFIRNLFEKIDSQTFYELSPDGRADFLEMVKEYNVDRGEWSELYG